MGIWDDIASGIASAPDRLLHLSEGLVKGEEKDQERELNKAGAGIGKKSAPPKAKPKATAKAKSTKTAKSTEPSASSLEQEIANSPWAQLSNALVQQTQQESAPIEAAISGGLAQPAAQSALDTALSAAGLSANSPAAQMLTQQFAQGQKQADPLMQAMASYGTAYAAGQQTFEQALTNSGQANALAIQSAPEQAALNALTQSYGKQDPSFYSLTQQQYASLPPALQYAIYSAGYGVGGAAPAAPKGGWGPNAPAVSSAASQTAKALTTGPGAAVTANSNSSGTGSGGVGVTG